MVSVVPVRQTTKANLKRLFIASILQAASDSFHAEKYKDSVRERILELIERKVAGEDITVASAPEPEHKIIDLMEALKASIAAGGGAAAKRKPARRATARTALGAKHTAHTNRLRV